MDVFLELLAQRLSDYIGLHLSPDLLDICCILLPRWQDHFDTGGPNGDSMRCKRY